MGRVKIKFPTEKPLYKFTLPVRISDINYGGHLGNDSVLSIVHEARMQLLHAAGYTELDAGGTALIMADVMIAYRGEAFYGEELTIALYVTEMQEMYFDILYHITTERSGDTVDIAHAKTTMVCFDYRTRQKMNMTPELKKVLEGVES